MEQVQHGRVFISYARTDAAFVDELAGGLELVGFVVTIDRHSIAEGEEWRSRLRALITGADTIVFVISPASVASSTCAWEIETARQNSKRLLPVMYQPVAPGVVPGDLSELNYVRFDDGRSFVAGLSALVNALNTDVEWVREHTRLMARAIEWDTAGRQSNRMLIGPDIEAAREWAANRPREAPALSELHLDYIAASEKAELERQSLERAQLDTIASAQAAQAAALAEREVAVSSLSRRTTIALITTGGLTAAAGGLAYWGVSAERRFQKAQANSIEAEIERASAREDIRGQFLAYAAAPGTVAAEGKPGGNSPYTETVLATLKDPSLSVYSALFRSHELVRTRSGTGQRPYLSTDMNGDIYLQRQPPSRKRGAIIVSVDTYIEKGVLYNVWNDAKAWTAFLRDKCGFAVRTLRNPKKAEIIEALRQPIVDVTGSRRSSLPRRHIHRAGFERLPENNTLAVFVYAGTGISDGGLNFLNTDDADHTKLAELSTSMLGLELVATELRKRAAASILILDTNFPTVDFIKVPGGMAPATPASPR